MIAPLIAGAYVGWNTGANDAGNSIGTSVVSGLLNYRRAVLLVSLFVVFGALLQGGHVMKTIGKGIVISELPMMAIIAALISSGLFVTLATFFRIPVSTSQSIVGAVIGAEILHGFRTKKILEIVIGWIVTPTAAGLFAFGLYRLMLLVLG